MTIGAATSFITGCGSTFSSVEVAQGTALALALATAIGISLPLMGSGGSIITLAGASSAAHLRKAFAWFVLAVAVFVVAKNLFFTF